MKHRNLHLRLLLVAGISSLFSLFVWLRAEGIARTVIMPPDDCSISIEVISVDCDDANTPDEVSDDVFTYTILVTGENTGDIWIADDGTIGLYGEVTTSVVHPYSDGTITVVITDESEGCSNSFTVSPPSPALICPEDTNDRPYTGTVQILQGRLDTEDDVFTEYPCFLKASTNPMTLGDRFFDAIIIYTPDDISSDTTDGVYSFHLFTDLELPPGAGMEGGTNDGSGVLTRGSYLNYDDPCCFSMSYDDRTEGDMDLTLENPDIDTTGFFDRPMNLVQKFSQQLKGNDQLSLVISTFAGNNTGNYAWVITSESPDSLRLEANQNEVTSQVLRQTLRTDLTHLSLGWALHNENSLDPLGRAILEPGCGVDSLYFSDVLDYNTSCKNVLIYRNFIVESGELTDTCVQNITFRRAELSDVILPPATQTFPCGEPFEQDVFGNPSPRISGYPLINNGEDYDTMFNQVQYFNLEAFYKDSISVDTTLNINTWEREWRIVDYCGDTTHVFRQLIKQGDFALPFLECPLSTHVCPILEEDIMLFGVDPFECTATVEVPEPNFRGFCNEERSVDWTIVSELLWAADTTLLDTIPTGGSRTVTNLEIGDYLVRYSATHHGGDRVERFCRIRVADLQSPQAICETTVVVDLAEDNTFTLDATRLDRGSTDNCGEIDFTIRRQYEHDSDCNPLDEDIITDWGPSVSFSCCDVNQTIAVDFQVADASGNINGCALRIEVIDSSPSEVISLEAQIFDCQALPADFDPLDSLQRALVFGQPALLNPCQEELVEIAPVVTWLNCESVEVVRQFQIKDAFGNLLDTVLVQENTINAASAFSIRFPEDITTDCVEALPGIEWIGLTCSDFDVDIQDEILTPTDEACYWLARTFVVTDNCRYDGSSEASVLSRDENCNGEEGEEAIWVVIDNDLAFTDADSDAGNSSPAAGALGADCGGDNPAGYWRSLNNTGRWTYTQIIRVVDEVTPVVIYTEPEPFCTTDSSCEAMVDIALWFEEFCVPNGAFVSLALDENNDGTIDTDLTNTSVLQGSWPGYEIAGAFRVGTHAFVLDATDGCGNSSETRIVFTVADCYIAPAVCATGVEVVLEAVNQVRDLDGDGIEDEAVAILSAASLANMAGTDCTGPYLYSVNEPGDSIDFSQDELILTCEDRYTATVELVVRDMAFNPGQVQPGGTLGGPNYDRCTVEISLQDPEENCRNCSDNELEIAGHVYTVEGEPISKVQMDLSQLENPYKNQTTDLRGSFLFDNLPSSRNFVLQASLNTNVLNGVTLMDMIILQRHLDNIVPITDSYLLLAADLDASGIVDALDYSLMRQLLLGQITELPNNSSWRFLPTTYNLTDIGANIPNAYRYFGLTTCQLEQDFLGVKVGDLNGSVQFISEPSTYPEEVSRRTGVPIFLSQQTLKPGDIARIPLRMRDLDQLSGLDLNILLANDQLRLLEVEPGFLGQEAIAIPKSGDGLLKAVWTATDGLIPAEETILFTLVVVAQTETDLTRGLMLSITPNAPALAYDPSLISYPLQFVFEDAQSDNLTLLAHYPDPFRLSTMLRFILPTEGRYTLKVRDVTGKLLFEQTAIAPAGMQQVQIDGGQWPGGVLNYTLTFGNQRLSRRMVKVE